MQSDPVFSVHWAKARFEVLRGKLEDAVFHYEQVSFDMGRNPALALL